MTVDVRYVFFISSTFEDLREERQQVIQAVLEHGHIPVGMEIFPSADDEPWKVIEETIAECDYYIVLSAGRYGSSFPDGRSYTEREFDLAVSKGVPVLGFIHKNPLDLPQSRRDDAPEKRRRLEEFHAKIRQRLVRTWITVEELGLQASKTITNATRTHPRTGWVRADKARSGADLEKLEELRRNIEELESENEKLSEDYERIRELVRRTVLSDDDIQPELLAQGSDIFEFSARVPSDSGMIESLIPVTWDECFAAIAPDLYQLVAMRDFKGAYSFEVGLKALLKRKSGLKGTRTVSYDRQELNKLMFQFKQLGYISIREAKSGGSGWSLTPAGEAHATRLLTRLK